MAAWVHNALIDSFLTAYQAFGPEPLTAAEEDIYVAEQSQLGALMGAEPLPKTATELRKWLVEHPAVAYSPAGAEAIAFLAQAPLKQPVHSAYRLLYQAAVATIPGALRETVGVTPRRGSRTGGQILVRVLRAALGASPAWAAALDRCGVARPDGVRFRETEDTTR
jgi:uncharacterized protein (DUF2236 family)